MISFIKRLLTGEPQVKVLTFCTTDSHKRIKTTRIPYTDTADLSKKLKFVMGHAVLFSEARHIHITAPGINITVNPQEVVE